MGLTFTAGNPKDVFTEPFAEAVRRTLDSQFGGRIVLDSPNEPAYSEELGWSGWRELQERAAATLPREQITHLLSMEAWQGVYVPCATEIGAFQFKGNDTPLDVASLDCLLQELERIGQALNLPTGDNGVQSLARSYADDDDKIDEEMDIQAYCQLLLVGREAKRRNQPLWIVK